MEISCSSFNIKILRASSSSFVWIVYFICHAQSCIQVLLWSVILSVDRTNLIRFSSWPENVCCVFRVTIIFALYLLLASPQTPLRYVPYASEILVTVIVTVLLFFFYLSLLYCQWNVWIIPQQNCRETKAIANTNTMICSLSLETQRF